MVKEIGNFLRNYTFLSLTKSTMDEVSKLPNRDWKQKGTSFGKVLFSVWAEIPTSIAVSGLRWAGCFNPPLPQPPSFPAPHSNVEFMDVSVKRALWDWKPSLKAEMKEGIADSISEKWNVFQVVGEWCIANSFEHPNYFKPSFLTASEPLENGTMFRDLTLTFSKLKQKDKMAIFDAVYHQTEIKPVSSAGKQVYQDLRAIASKLTQGNEAFKNAYQEYAQKAAAVEPAPVTAPLSARTVYPAIAPAARYEAYVPSFMGRPAQAILPSAPDLSAVSGQDEEQKILRDIAFMRKSVKEGITYLGGNEKKRVIDLITGDTKGGTSYGHASVETSPKYCVARLSLLRFFKEAFKERGSLNVPDFLWTRALSSQNKSIHEVGQSFAALHERDYVKLQQIILHPQEMHKLDATLRKRLSELNEFAEIISKKQDFSEMYSKLQIDLVAG